MTTAVTMPVLGLTMEEGTVAEWLKQVGDTVARDEPLLTVEMDKGTVEVPSPVAGVLSRILVDVGATVAVRTPIAEISGSAEAVATLGLSRPSRARPAGPATCLREPRGGSNCREHARPSANASKRPN